MISTKVLENGPYDPGLIKTKQNKTKQKTLMVDVEGQATSMLLKNLCRGCKLGEAEKTGNDN